MMMAEKNKLMREFKEFTAMYSKSRLGMAGLILLLIFVVIGVCAPLITPYDPQNTMQLANFRSEPEWLNAETPKNMYPVSDPGFTSSTSLQEWTLSGTGISTTWTGQEGYGGIAYIEKGSGSGALVLSTTSTDDATATIGNMLTYNYKPPHRFSVHLAYKAEVVGEATWNAQVIMRQTTGQELVFWDSGIQSSSIDWSIPKPQIDTNDAILRIKLFKDILSDASKVFPQKGDYTLILRLTTKSQGGSVKFYVDDFSARIWGDSFGLLGTDNYGRDILTQLLYGSRISILIGVFSAIIAVGLGLIVGLASGYVGGWVDELLMRFNDILLTIPSLPLLIVLTAVLGPSIYSVVILIGFLGWMGIARLIRSQVLSLKEKAFVEAARASGGGTWHIIWKHLVPNVITMAYTQLALTVPGAIVTEAALSFLGLGDPFIQTWGKMLHDVQYYGAVSEWWWAIPPGLCIALLSMAFVFIGYAMDDILNPKLRRR
jgi:peptide/nickel transport system permease protein